MELQWVLLILSLRKDKHLLVVYIYDLSQSTGGFYKYLLNTTVHYKELSGVINLRSDLGFQESNKNEADHPGWTGPESFLSFSCYTSKWRMIPSLNTTIMNYKLYLSVGSKRSYVSFETNYALSTHERCRISLKQKKSST